MGGEAQVGQQGQERRQGTEAAFRYTQPELREAESTYQEVKDTALVKRTERVLFKRVKKKAQERGMELSDDKIREIVHRQILRWIHFLHSAGISKEQIKKLFNSDVWNNEGKKAIVGSITFAKLLADGKFASLWGEASQKRIQGFVEEVILRYEEKRQGAGFGKEERLKFNPGNKSFEEYYAEWRKENAAALERIAKKLYNGSIEDLSREKKEDFYRLTYEQLWFGHLFGEEDASEEREKVEAQPEEKPQEQRVEQASAKKRAEAIVGRIEEVYGKLEENMKAKIMENLVDVLEGRAERADFGLQNAEKGENLLSDEELKQLLAKEGLEIRKTKDELEGGRPGVSLVIARPRA